MQTMDMNGQSRALPGKLFQLMDEERRRLAREVHDELGQQVAHIEFHLEQLSMQLPMSRQKIAGQLGVIREEVAAFANDLRRTAHRLHPATLEHLDFATAIRSYAAEFATRTGTPTALKCPEVLPALSPALSSSLFSIVREALQNICKHAGPDAVAAITIASKGHMLALKVEDSGDGFKTDVGPVTPGLGLISIRERVRLLNGRVTIRSVTGAGVCIKLVVPTSYTHREPSP